MDQHLPIAVIQGVDFDRRTDRANQALGAPEPGDPPPTVLGIYFADRDAVGILYTGYSDCLGHPVYEYRVVTVHAGATDEETLWVAHVVVDDFKATEAANFRVGDVQRLVLEPIEEPG